MAIPPPSLPPPHHFVFPTYGFQCDFCLLFFARLTKMLRTQRDFLIEHALATCVGKSDPRKQLICNDSAPQRHLGGPLRWPPFSTNGNYGGFAKRRFFGSDPSGKLRNRLAARSNRQGGFSLTFLSWLLRNGTRVSTKPAPPRGDKSTSDDTCRGPVPTRL